MKKILTLLMLILCTFFSRAQFSSITTLDPIPIGGIDTQHKPQAKTWFYAGKWWCALPPSIGGTWIFRLDGSTWTPILRLATSGSRTDCWVSGDLVHILMFRGSGANAISTLQYDPGTGKYVAWSRRPAVTNITLPSGVESATLAVDGTGRMWIAADGVNEIFTWWSDAPYTTFSSAITVATGINSDDISAVTKLQGKIGIFWSNQNTGLFGFRTHDDGTNPTTWSTAESPASQSAIPGNPRMADDHMNLTSASDGTLYCVAKTSYNNASLPQLLLLIRRPQGTWDNAYPVTIGVGTQAIVLLNEAAGKIKIVYTTETNGGQILYKETSVSNISFTPAAVLMGPSNANYNFSSSTHFSYNPDVAIVATDQGTPRQIVSVLASDGPGDVTPPSVLGILRSSPSQQNTTATSVTFAVNFSESVTGVNAPDFTLTTGGTASGTIGNVTGSGSTYNVTVNGIAGTGSLRLDLNASGTGILDLANNAIQGGFTGGEQYNVSPADVTAPSVTGIARFSPTTQGTTATSVIFQVTFSESVTGVNAPDFVLATGGTAGGTIGTVTGSGSTYNVPVNAISGTGSLRLDLKSTGTGIEDLANNPIQGGFTTGEHYDVSPSDVTAPVVVSILRSSPTSQNTSAASVIFEVNFSEAVTGVDAPDFNLTTGGTVAATIGNVTGSGGTYNVAVNGITGTGSLRLDLKSSGTGIQDAANNPVQGGFTTGEQYNISPADVTAPFVTSIVRLSPLTQNTSATTVVFQVNFSEAVNGVNANDFTLVEGGTVNATINSLLGVCASYTVTVSSISGTGTLGVNLKNNNTDIVDAVGNPITGGFTTGETYEIGGSQALTASGTINSSSMVIEDENPSSSTTAEEIRAIVYPNPFEYDATFSFILKSTEKYTVKLFNSSGLAVARLDEGTANANVPRLVRVRGSKLADGMYVISIETKKHSKVLKLIKK